MGGDARIPPQKKHVRCEILRYHENLMGYELRGRQPELSGTSSGRNFCWRRRPTSTSKWISHRKSCRFVEVPKMAVPIGLVYFLGTSGRIPSLLKARKGQQHHPQQVQCHHLREHGVISSPSQLQFLKSDLNQISSALFISLSSHPSLLARSEQVICYFWKWVLLSSFWGKKCRKKTSKNSAKLPPGASS